MRKGCDKRCCKTLTLIEAIFITLIHLDALPSATLKTTSNTSHEDGLCYRSIPGLRATPQSGTHICDTPVSQGYPAAPSLDHDDLYS